MSLDLLPTPLGEGLGYKCGSTSSFSGTTDVNGTFNCIGAVLLCP